MKKEGPYNPGGQTGKGEGLTQMYIRGRGRFQPAKKGEKGKGKGKGGGAKPSWIGGKLVWASPAFQAVEKGQMGTDKSRWRRGRDLTQMVKMIKTHQLEINN